MVRICQNGIQHLLSLARSQETSRLILFEAGLVCLNKKTQIGCQGNQDSCFFSCMGLKYYTIKLGFWLSLRSDPSARRRLCLTRAWPSGNCAKQWRWSAGNFYCLLRTGIQCGLIMLVRPSDWMFSWCDCSSSNRYLIPAYSYRI